MTSIEWQPIDTAPKDGTQVFLFSEGNVLVGWYVDKQHFSYGIETYSRQEWTYQGEHMAALIRQKAFLPTHWMAIPAPADVYAPEEVTS